MPDDDPVLTESCEYYCDGDNYWLLGGTAPPGFMCAETLGPCSQPGEEVVTTPVAIPVIDPAAPPPPEDPPPGEAMYRYEPKADEFFFANAKKAPSKKSYMGRVSLKDLAGLFPDVAKQAEAKKAANPGKSFNQAIPAVDNGKRPKNKNSY